MNKYVAFLVYTVFWQTLVWGLFGYVVFGLGNSGWWFVLAFFMAGSQYKPRRFGIEDLSDE